MRLEHWLYRIPLWLRGVLRRPAVERELDDEIRDHIERQTAANIASGMRSDQAHRAALLSFGGVERVKDESRDVRGLTFLDGVAQLRLTVRSLLRARMFTVATTITVALAVGAGCTVFTVFNAVLLRPLPYPQSERLVGLWHSFPGIGLALAEQAPGTYLSYRDQARSFESMGAYIDETVTIEYPDHTLSPERVPIAVATPSLFPTLGAHPLIGRLFTEADGREGAPTVVLLSEGFWRARLQADPNVLGHVLSIDGAPSEIVGVVPRSFTFPASDIRLWASFVVIRSSYLGNFNFRAIGRLKPGVSLGTVQKELQRILMRTPESFPSQRFGVSTASALAATRAVAVVRTLQADAIAGFGRILWLVAATVGLLVLVAFSNVGSLVLVRIEGRQREFAVRATLGASRGRVWGSLLAESAVVSVMGGIVGVAMALGALAYLAHLGPTALPDPMLAGGGRVVIPRLDEIHLDATFAWSAVALTAAMCLVSASIGSWRLASVDSGRLLREGGRGGTGGQASQRMRMLFVAAEVALSLVLLSGSAVLGRSLLRVRAIRPGFSADSTLTFWTTLTSTRYRNASDISRYYRAALDAVSRVPGVESVGIVNKLPLEGWFAAIPTFVEDAPPKVGVMPPIVAYESASSGYFKTMGIPILAGRAFDDAAVQEGAAEVVATRGFALLYWNDSTGQRALGKRIRPNARWYTIVGVVGDVRDTALTAAPISALYFPEEAGSDTMVAWPRATRDMAFVVRSRGSPLQLVAVVERAVHALDPDVPIYDVAPMTERVAKAGSRMSFALLLLAAGAAATLALGMVGLYGVIAHVVGLRRREIGIRIALGLAPTDAARAILGQGELIIVSGAVIGVVVFLAFARLLRSLAFEVSVVDSAALVASCLTVLVVATVATWLPARRAAKIDPAEALKNE